MDLFRLNPALDRKAAQARFQAKGRVQIRNFLTPESADAVHHVLATATPWGMALKAAEGPQDVAPAALATMSAQDRAMLGQAVGKTMRAGGYGFVYQRYPMVTAYLEHRDPDGPLAMLLEHINDAPLKALVTDITGVQGLVKADAQATLFAAGQFLGLHDDRDQRPDDGRRIAYVMGFTRNWHPDWGGYLNFFDDEGDIVEGFRPRFNCLNMFSVPQRHHVSYVPMWSPPGRFAITGWFRDR